MSGVSGLQHGSLIWHSGWRYGFAKSTDIIEETWK